MIEPKEFIDQLGLNNVFVIPHDLAAMREAMSGGKMLAEVAPKSKLSQAIQNLATTLIEAVSPKHVPTAKPPMGTKELFKEIAKAIRGH